MDELIEAGQSGILHVELRPGFLPVDLMKDRLRQLGEKILPHYR
jgi:hypothetical protein